MIVLAIATGLYAYLVGPLLRYIFTGGSAGGEKLFGWIPGVTFDVENKESMLAAIPLLIIGLGAVKGASYLGQFYLMGSVGQRVMSRIRREMFDRLTSLSLSFFHKASSGEVVSRFANDVQKTEEVVSTALASLLRDTLEVAVLIILALSLDIKLALVTLAALPLAAVPITKFGRMIRRASVRANEHMGGISTRVAETMHGARLMKGAGTEKFERTRFAAEDEKYVATMLRSYLARASSSPVMELLGGIALATTLWYAGSRIASGDLAPEHFVSFYAAILMAYQPLKTLGRLQNTLQPGLAAAERIFELMDTPVEIEEKPGAIELSHFTSAIEYRDVTFDYGNGPVLHGVNLTVSRGDVVALVGESGGGKSTLLSLLPRLHDPTAGAVSIDGHDLRDVTLDSLRANLAIVSQEVVLFNDTVRYNLSYGNPLATEPDLWQAALAAQAKGFIDRLPRGLDTIIGEGGVRLSGGERQRLAIARAILRDAPILILDEATSALDSENEALVQAALANLMLGRTVLVIAHRLSTVRRADRIVVIEQGRVVETGHHDALVAQSGPYRRFHDLQFPASRESEVAP